MQTQKNQRRASKSPRSTAIVFVDVNGNGKKVKTEIGDLANSDRTRYHGTVDGRQVNSITGIKHGASMVLTNGKGGAMAATDDELLAFSAKYLQDAGHTIQFKSGTQISVAS